MIDGVDLIGTGPLGDRLWFKPSITVIGIDAPSLRKAANILIPRASAKISMRIAPDADAGHEVQILMDHLRSAAPWNVRIDVKEVGHSAGFTCPTGGPGYVAAKSALETVFGQPVLEKGNRGFYPAAECSS